MQASCVLYWRRLANNRLLIVQEDHWSTHTHAHSSVWLSNKTHAHGGGPVSGLTRRSHHWGWERLTARPGLGLPATPPPLGYTWRRERGITGGGASGRSGGDPVLRGSLQGRGKRARRRSAHTAPPHKSPPCPRVSVADRVYLRHFRAALHSGTWIMSECFRDMHHLSCSGVENRGPMPSLYGSWSAQRQGKGGGGETTGGGGHKQGDGGVRDTEGSGVRGTRKGGGVEGKGQRGIRQVPRSHHAGSTKPGR